MRLLLAARLSQDHSGQTGLGTQDADARAWAERNGHEVIAAAADKISGRVSPFDRPNLGPWLKEPTRVRLYDGVIVSKLDRLSRGRDWNIRAWAEQSGKKLLVVSPRYETVTIRGHDHAAEIAEVETDLRELDFDDPEFEVTQKALLAERARLRGLKRVPDDVRRKPTGDTIGGHWQTPDHGPGSPGIPTAARHDDACSSGSNSGRGRRRLRGLRKRYASR